MPSSKKYLLFSSFLLALMNCSSPRQEVGEEWEILFDGSDLELWDTYLGPEHDENLSQEEFQQKSPVGLNNDPAGVFKIVEEDGQPTLRISGQTWGGISTKDEFKNYHLHLQFKWGKEKWFPRGKEEDKRDSGILYHAVGSHGADNGFWMRSQELQIQEGDCGDYWGVAGGIFDIPARLNQDSLFQFDKDGPFLIFSDSSVNGRRCVKNPDAENPTGEWNTIDLFCSGDTAVHVVNGVVNMILYNSRQSGYSGEIPLTKGKIQIQSEGAEVFYRFIRIRQIDQLPKYLLN